MKWCTYLCCLGLGVRLAVAEEPPASGKTGPAAPAPAPQIHFDELKHDFGSVEPVKLSHAFKFKNTGNATLEVKSVQPGCGCTVIPDYDRKVEPGKEGQIKVEINAANFKGQHIEKGVTVSSNDPRMPNTHLTISADVKIELAVLPQSAFWLGRLKPDSVVTQAVEIKSMLPQPLVVDKVDVSAPWLTATVTSSTTNLVSLVLVTKPPLPMGMLRATATAHTQYEKYKTVPITFTAQVPSMITVLPTRLFFLKTQEKKPFDLDVSVKRNDGKQFHITKVDTKSPLLSATVTPREPGISYLVRVSYQAKDGQPPADGKIEILTDEPLWPKVEIPYAFK